MINFMLAFKISLALPLSMSYLNKMADLRLNSHGGNELGLG